MTVTKAAPLPSINQWESGIKLLALEVFICAAAVNCLWQAYHKKATQASMNGGNVLALVFAKDAVDKGMVADNVQASQDLQRDLSGTAHEYRELLNDAKQTLAKYSEQFKEEREQELSQLSVQQELLKGQVSKLEAQIEGLKETNKELQEVKNSLKQGCTDLQKGCKHLNGLLNNAAPI